MRRWISGLGPVVLYAAAIFLVSGQSELPSTRIWDKAAHFGEYAILGFLVARAIFLISGWAAVRSAVVAVLLATAFAFTDEVHQYFVPGRDADLLDIVADFLGSVAGSSAYVALLTLRARMRGAPQASN
jgi:VanZ family protein